MTCCSQKRSAIATLEQTYHANYDGTQADMQVYTHYHKYTHAKTCVGGKYAITTTTHYFHIYIYAYLLYACLCVLTPLHYFSLWQACCFRVLVCVCAGKGLQFTSFLTKTKKVRTTHTATHTRQLLTQLHGLL